MQILVKFFGVLVVKNTIVTQFDDNDFVRFRHGVIYTKQCVTLSQVVLDHGWQCHRKQSHTVGPAGHQTQGIIPLYDNLVRCSFEKEKNINLTSDNPFALGGSLSRQPPFI